MGISEPSHNHDSHRRDELSPARTQILKAPSSEMITYDEPSVSDWIMANKPVKYGIAVFLVVLALVSVFALRPHFEKAETWTSTIETIDAKKANVLALTGSTVALSAGISAIPGDAGTPIAETLMDLSQDLGIVLGVLYLEKYLLTIFSFTAFALTVPAACIGFLVALFMHGKFSTSSFFSRFACRMLVISMVLIFVIPASIGVTEMIDTTFQTALTSSAEAADSSDVEAAIEDDGESGNTLLDFINNLGESISNGVTSLSEGVLSSVNTAIEGVAVMIVTSCVIPVLVLLLFLYLAHMLLGINISKPMTYISNRTMKTVAPRK